MTPLPTWLAMLIVFGGGLLVIYVIAVPLVPWLDRERKPKVGRGVPTAPPQDRSPHDKWSGHCYRCGALVDPKVAVSLHRAGKPPQYFCPDCRPRF